MPFADIMLSITQIYKMKAIHNHYHLIYIDGLNVVNNANIQNESNSQPLVSSYARFKECCQ